MPLTVAVQTDHIATFKIKGDTNFALMLEAQRRGHRLLHYPPDRLAMRGGKVTARDREICETIGPELKRRGGASDRHRRDRRLHDGDQCHVTHGHPRGAAVWGRGYRGDVLGQGGGEDQLRMT